MTPAERDVVVVGGGIIGLSCAWFLARAGRRVTVLERRTVGAEASGRNGGHLSPTIDPTWGPLGLLSYDLWADLAAELGPATEYRRQGGVYVVSPTEPLAPAEILAFRRGLGFTAELLSSAECQRVLPGLRQELQGGLFSPRSAQINPIATMKLFARAARAAGVDLREHTPATAIRTHADAVLGVDTPAGLVAAPIVVDAAGPWAGDLAALAGASTPVPITPRRIQILLSEALPPTYGPVWAGNGLYARQAHAGQLHFGTGGPTSDPPPDTIDRQVTLPTMQRIAHRLLELMPGLADLRILRSWAGVLAVTPDHNPIVDWCPRPTGLLVATGFAGNGFVLGPAVGLVVSQLICTGQAELDLTPLRLARFTAA
jgi:sarcosine oxidase subunit beta